MIPQINIPTQYRTSQNTFLFQSKGSNTKIRVYNLMNECLFKETIPTSPQFDSRQYAEQYLKNQKLLYPSILEESLDQVNKIIQRVQYKVALESSEVQKFICPITQEVFEDPVTDKCGCTFEKSAILEYLTKSNNCPLTRSTITPVSLVPNRAVKQHIEELQKKIPIPTLSLFSKSHPDLAKKNFDLAESYEEAEEFDSALEAYSMGFRYTNQLADYRRIPEFFRKTGQNEKMILSSLYLVSYLIQEKNFSEAINMLGPLGPTVPLAVLIANLFVLRNRGDLAINFLIARAATAVLTADKLLLFKHAFSIDPDQFTFYQDIADLSSDHREKAHYLFTGACRALQNGDTLAAERFCRRAEECGVQSFVHLLVRVHLFLCQKSPPETLMRIFESLESPPSSKTLEPWMLKILVSVTGEADEYVKEVADCYEILNKPHKAFLWHQKLLTSYVAQARWPKAGPIAQKLLKNLPERLPDDLSLFHALIKVYSNWDIEKHPDIFDAFGSKAMRNGQMTQAESIYRMAKKTHFSLRFALPYAESLELQGKIGKSVKQFYKAACIAIESDCSVLEKCILRIQALDPQKQFLEPLKHERLILHQKIYKQELRIKELTLQLERTEKEKAKPDPSKERLPQFGPSSFGIAPFSSTAPDKKPNAMLNSPFGFNFPNTASSFSFDKSSMAPSLPNQQQNSNLPNQSFQTKSSTDMFGRKIDNKTKF